MKFTTAAVLAVLGSNIALAKNIISGPFQLVALSEKKSLNGSIFFPCHEGAGIEALCSGKGTVGSKSTSNYTFEYDNSEVSGDGGPLGILRYGLHYTNSNNKPAVEQEPLTMYIDPSTNVALPLFQPGGTIQYVGFDKNNLLNLQSGVNDTSSPPKAGNPIPYYRWYVCNTLFESYTYETLNWVYGEAVPQNPSCEKVSVVRVFPQ